MLEIASETKTNLDTTIVLTPQCAGLVDALLKLDAEKMHSLTVSRHAEIRKEAARAARVAKPQGKPKTKPKSQRLKKFAKLRPAAAATKPVAGAAAGAKPKLVKAKVCTKKFARNPIKMSELEWDASNLKRNNAGRNLIKTKLDELRRRDLAQKPGNPAVDAKTGIIRANIGWEGLTFTRFLALAPGHFEKL